MGQSTFYVSRCHALALAIALSLIPVTVFSQPLSPAGRDGADKVNVLVKMNPGADRSGVRALAARHGAKVRYEYRKTRGLRVYNKAYKNRRDKTGD